MSIASNHLEPCLPLTNTMSCSPKRDQHNQHNYTLSPKGGGPWPWMQGHSGWLFAVTLVRVTIVHCLLNGKTQTWPPHLCPGPPFHSYYPWVAGVELSQDYNTGHSLLCCIELLNSNGNPAVYGPSLQSSCWWASPFWAPTWTSKACGQSKPLR